MADLERDLLVAERPRVLARRQDLDEGAGDVRHGEVPGGGGAAVHGMELGVGLADPFDDLRHLLVARIDEHVLDGTSRYSPGSIAGLRSRRARKRIGPGGSQVRSSTWGLPRIASFFSSIAEDTASGRRFSSTSPLISSAKRFATTDSGAFPFRNPGSAARRA